MLSPPPIESPAATDDTVEPGHIPMRGYEPARPEPDGAPRAAATDVFLGLESQELRCRLAGCG